MGQQKYELFGSQILPRAEGGEAMATINYLGRIGFGKGAINAAEVSREEFEAELRFLSEECVIPIESFLGEAGGCMDARRNKMDELGNPVAPRPKVIGGPSLWAWNVAVLGNFGLISKDATPMDQFITVNKRLVEANFGLGMHRVCGAANGVDPVLETYDEQIEQVAALSGERSRSLFTQSAELNAGLKRNIKGARELVAAKGSNFTEDAMIEEVKKLAGPASVVHLQVDPNHPNKSHEEGGLVLFRALAKINKDLFFDKFGARLFMNNCNYALTIANALAQTPQERLLAEIIVDQLPIAGVATLGSDQHVGEIAA